MLRTESETREVKEAAQEAEKIEQTKERISEGLFIGVDIGQAHDASCFVGIERVRVTTFDKWQPSETARVDLNDPMSTLEPVFLTDIEYHVRVIEKIRLGTSYSDVVRALLNLVERPEVKSRNPIIVLDGVGIGRAVYDMIIEAGIKNVKSVTVTGSTTGAMTDDDPFYMVGKADVVSTVKALFGRGILRIAKNLKEADALTRELESFLVKRQDGGRSTYEAAPSAHDDLVSALGLACFIATQFEVMPLVAPHEIRRDGRDGLRIGRRAARGFYSMSNKQKY